VPARTEPFYAAAPAVTIGGRTSAEVDEALVAVQVTETVAGLARCELTLTNWGTRDGQVGFLWFDRDVIDLGHELLITIGDGERRGAVFDGVVTGLEAQYPQSAAPQLVVLAEDRLQVLRMTRRTRTFEDVTDADVIRTVVGDHGLRADVQADGPTHRIVAQVNTSDLAFVRDRARLLDADLRLDDTTLLVRSRARRDASVGSWDRGADLREFTVTADLAHQRSAVHVSGYDPQAKEAIDAETTASAIAGELEGGESGPALVESVFGSRVERLVHLAPASRAEAQALADHALHATARRLLTATAVVEGDARARPGTRGTFRELGPLFSGTYDIVGARHSFDQVRGLQSTLDLERAGLGGRS
jgi:uncharacterized protein